MSKDNVADILKYWDQEKDNRSAGEKMKMTSKLLLVNTVRLNLKISHAGYDLIYFKYQHEGKEYRYQAGWDKILRTFEHMIKGETKEGAKLAAELIAEATSYIVEEIERDIKNNGN